LAAPIGDPQFQRASTAFKSYASFRLWARKAVVRSLPLSIAALARSRCKSQPRHSAQWRYRWYRHTDDVRAGV